MSADVGSLNTAARVQKLLDVTKESIETTTEQNKKLGKYTFWMMVMTGIITVCTIIQVIVAIYK